MLLFTFWTIGSLAQLLALWLLIKLRKRQAVLLKQIADLSARLRAVEQKVVA